MNSKKVGYPLMRGMVTWGASMGLRSMVWAGVVALVGCSLMPTYVRPDAPIPQTWPGVQAEVAAVSELPSWSTFLADPVTRELIRVALSHNRDLRVAALNIEQARAQLGIRRADQFPTWNVAASGLRAPTSGGGIGSTYSSGLAVTAYELDFFGRVASLKEQALSQYLATQESWKTAQIVLMATVAQGWFNLLADRELGVLWDQTVTAREESLKLVELKLRHGTASELDWRTAQSLLETARVAQAQQKRQQALDQNAMVLLLGQDLPDAARESLKSGFSLTSVPSLDVPPGLPSDLLTRRPDIRMAERLLMASHANVGVARAAFFPRISLTAQAGSASTELADLWKDGSWGWTFNPQLVLPIFDAGRNRSNLEAAQVGRDVAVAQYEKAIQVAFREVADALAANSALSEQLQASEAWLQAEEDRARLTQLRLDHGTASRLDWLDAQRSLLAARQGVVQTRLAVLQNRIALYKALGGGGDPPTESPIP